MSNVSSWSTTAASNNSAAPNGAPEGMAPSGVNDVIRENMAAVSKFYKDTQGTLVSTGSSNAYVLTTNNAHATLGAQSLLVFRANHTNTGAATLAVDGLAAKSIRSKGAAISADEIISGSIISVAYNSNSDVYDMIGSGTLRNVADYQSFTANGTWTAAANISFVLVQVFAAGGGGGAVVTNGDSCSGGGGGECVWQLFEASDLGATETVTVGTGGAGGATGGNNAGTDGGNSSFGSWLTAYGGKGGMASANSPAMPRGALTFAQGFSRLTMAQAGIGGYTNEAGGSSINGGGGGGGGGTTTSGGTSEWAGDGGAGNNTLLTAGGNGTAPSGGGGGSSNQGNGGTGARGEVRVWSW